MLQFLSKVRLIGSIGLAIEFRLRFLYTMMVTQKVSDLLGDVY